MSTPVHVRDDLTALPGYVPGARPTRADTVKLSSNELPYDIQPTVLAALTQAAATANRYPEMAGDTLRQAIATRHGLAPEQVVVGNGSTALIQHVLDTVCEPGSEVVLPWRSFEAYPICIQVAGATPRPVPLTASARHDVPAMLDAITPTTRAVIACTPNNPTSTILTADELTQLADGVPDDVLLLIDEAYLDFTTDPAAGNALTLLPDHPNLVVARTFSKAHALAGLRVGWTASHPDLAATIRAVTTPFAVNLPAQAAATAATGEAESAQTAQRASLIATERDRLVDTLRHEGWTVPHAQGNFYWLPVGHAATALARHLADDGVLVRPFDGDGVRVTVSTPADNERALAALRTWTGARG